MPSSLRACRHDDTSKRYIYETMKIMTKMMRWRSEVNTTDKQIREYLLQIHRITVGDQKSCNDMGHHQVNSYGVGITICAGQR